MLIIHRRNRLSRLCRSTAPAAHQKMGGFRRQLVLMAAWGLILAAEAWAIRPSQWVQTTEADFAAGQMNDTVVTNLGDLKLSAKTRLFAELPEQATILNDMQIVREHGAEVLYLATGPEAKLLRRTDDQIEEVLSLDQEQIFALSVYQGKLLLAISGPTSRLAILENGQLRDLVQLKEVRYLWDVLIDADLAYLATGTEGKLLRVDLAAENEPGVIELLDAAQANLLCLARDGKGNLYVGTDTDGLVYRIRDNPDGVESFVLYDAAEPEIGALLVLADGTVYAGTADAEQARPGRLEAAAAIESGRPEKLEPKEEAKPEEPGDLPQVPPKPDPAENDDADAEINSLEPNEAADEAAIGAGEPGPTVDQQVQFARQRAQLHAAEAQTDPVANVTEPPTAQQHDELRQVIRERLQKARQTGTLQAMPRGARPVAAAAPTARRPAPTPAAARKEGNAIYRIDPDHFVTEVFRETVMILQIVQDPSEDGTGKLLVATGNEGQVFRLDPAAEETTILADLKPAQIPVLLTVEDPQAPKNGRYVLMGTANPATVVRLDSGFAQEGVFTSAVLDASQVSLWGKLQLVAAIKPQTSVAIEVRSGNVADPEKAAWSAWSQPQLVRHLPNAPPLTPVELAVEVSPARFFQYRFTLKGDGQTTPVVDRLEMAYVVPNLRPQVTSLQARYADDPTHPSVGPSAAPPPRPAAAGKSGEEEPSKESKLAVRWEASDPNADALRYTLEFRAVDDHVWLPLAKDLDVDNFEWQTLRIPDGRYLIRVTATDAPGNPAGMAISSSRQSDPVLVDNTPPQFEGLHHEMPEGVLAITTIVRDALSAIRSLHYAVDSMDNWQAVLPEDLIYDSTSESFVIRITDLLPGPHVISLRAIDARGNNRYEAVRVEIRP